MSTPTNRIAGHFDDEPSPRRYMLCFIADFLLGETVYLKVARSKRPGVITRLCVNPDGSVTYSISWGTDPDTAHYACELSRGFERDWSDADGEDD